MDYPVSQAAAAKYCKVLNALLGSSKHRILGLTGQAGGRIGIRFWHRSTIGELLKNLAAHHADLAIVRQWEPGPKVKNPDPEFPRFSTGCIVRGSAL